MMFTELLKQLGYAVERLPENLALYLALAPRLLHAWILMVVRRYCLHL